MPPGTDVQDPNLVAAFQAGDRNAFETIVRRHYAALMAVADRRCGGGALAEDAVQQALVRAHRYLPTAGPIQNLGAWLRRLLHNCLNDLQRRERRALSGAEIPQHAATQTDWDQGEIRDLVSDTIERIPETYREPLRLHLLIGLEAREIAAQLGQNLHSVKSRLARGRRELRRRLEGPLKRAGYLT